MDIIRKKTPIPIPPKKRIGGLQSPNDIKEQLYSVINIFELLKNTSKTKEKKAILEAHKDNQLFYEMLKFLCNDNIVTGLSTKKINKELVETDELKLTPIDISEIISYLKENNTGKNADISLVQRFINLYPDKEEFLKEFFSKTYKFGVTAVTLNSVIPDSVPEESVMLAESYFKEKKNKDGSRTKIIAYDIRGRIFIVTVKLDGMRIIAIKNKDSIIFKSRTGKLIEGLDEILNEFTDGNIPCGIYDGELLAIGEFAESKDQYKETMKRARKKGKKTGLKMVCFDYIEDIVKFNNGYDGTPCIDRKDKLFQILNSTVDPTTGEEIEYLSEATPKYELIKYAMPIYIGDDPDELKEYFESAIALGEEGIMVNLADAPYECKRVKNLLKYKEFYNADLRVLGVYEGTGKTKGKLGGIYVDYKGFTDKVGSGFSQEEREKYFENPDLIVGKIVDIRYFEETTNQVDDEISMRFASFKSIREDKTEPSYEI